MGRAELRTILHLDLDAFFCAVEELSEPSLRGKPFAVGGRPEARGVVASCSYAARKFGVRSAMPMARARRLCPGLIIISHRHRHYSKISRQVMERLRKLTKEVEQISIDEAFVDISDQRKPSEVVARELQARIQRELKLPSSLGVASNKLVAKIATEVGKASYTGDGPPNAITVVPRGQEAAFLAPLPAEALWGVGPKTGARLAELGLHTIGDLARQPDGYLEQLFGKHGHDLARRARGIDERGIVTERQAKSVSHETTFAQDVANTETLQATLQRLSQAVAHRLQRSRLMGPTVKLKLRWSDFTTLTRQVTLERPTDQENEILEAAEGLLAEAWQSRRPVRLIGVGVSGLGPPVRQLSLWDTLTPVREDHRRTSLQAALDELQARFGPGIVHWGTGEQDGGARGE